MSKKDDFTNLSEEEIRELKEYLSYEKKTTPKKKINDMGLISFLETESERQEKLYEFFEKKLSRLKKFPQGQSLLDKQNKFNKEKREEIISLIGAHNSTFIKAISNSFKSYFQKKDSR